MHRTQPAEAIRQAVNHDVPAWGHAACTRLFPVLFVRIRDVNRFVELAIRVPAVKNVKAFGRLVIALLLLASRGRAPQSHLVGLKNFALR